MDRLGNGSMIHDQFIHVINTSVNEVFAMQPWKIEQEPKTEEESRNLLLEFLSLSSNHTLLTFLFHMNKGRS